MKDERNLLEIIFKKRSSCFINEAKWPKQDKSNQYLDCISNELWEWDELQNFDRRTRNVMTMNRELNPRSNVSRFCVCMKKGWRGIVRTENCIKAEENIPDWYIRHNSEDMLEMVELYGHLLNRT